MLPKACKADIAYVLLYDKTSPRNFLKSDYYFKGKLDSFLQTPKANMAKAYGEYG
jgi:hypothetical protein